jgi:hypothetical protein
MRIGDRHQVTTNVPRCMLAIIGEPLLLVLIVWLFRFSDFHRARVLLWRWRRRLRRLSQRHQQEEEGQEVGGPPDAPLGKRREWITFAHYLSYVAIGPLLMTATKFGSFLLLTSSDERNSPEPAEQAISILALLIPTVFAAYCFAFQRLFVLNAVGLPIVIIGFARETKTLFEEQRSFEEWAVKWGYLCLDSIDSDAYVHLGDTQLGAGLAPLPIAAVAIHKIGLLVQLGLMVMALFKLLWIPLLVKSYLISRGWMSSGKKDDFIVESVFRLTRRFDLEQFTDEYYIDISSPTARTCKQIFRLLSRSGATDVAVWLSADLCLCNFNPATTATNRSDPAIILESICSITLPGIDPVLGVYGTMSEFRSIGESDSESNFVESRVEIMDSIFCLLSMYDGGGFPVQIQRAQSVVGRFPISVRGLNILIQEPSCGRYKRLLHLQNLGLSSDQWDCILRCQSQNVHLSFCGQDFAQSPDAIHSLIQALQGNHCRARINMGGLQCLPEHVLEDFAIALERNKSITALGLTVGVLNAGTANAFPAIGNYGAIEVVLSRILGCLCQRRAPLDVLDLSVTNFSTATWTCLWNEVVPSKRLYVRCLDLRIRTHEGAFVVDEDLMIRSICASTSMCAFQYRNCLRDEPYLERIDNSVRPYLEFNRFRRLVLCIEQEPDVALQDRWFAALLLNIVVQRHPARCYFLLKRNARELLSNVRWDPKARSKSVKCRDGN